MYERKFKIELKKRGYSGELIPIKGAASLARLSDPNGNESKLKRIRGTMFELDIIPDANTVEDLWNIDEREWRLVVSEYLGGLVQYGEVSIDQLDTAITETTSIASFRLDAVGGLSYAPTCKAKVNCSSSLSEYWNTSLYQELPFYVASLYAVPVNEGVDYSGRVFIGSVNVTPFSVSESDIAQKFIDKYPDIFGVVLSDKILVYRQSTYSTQINSNWNLKLSLEFLDPSKNYSLSGYNFTGSTERDYLEVKFRTYPPGGEAVEISLALIYSGSSISGSLVGLANQINGTGEGTLLDNVYITQSNEYKSIRVKAEVVDDEIKLSVYDAGTDSEGILMGYSPEATCFFVTKNNNDSYSTNFQYTYLNSLFSGGALLSSKYGIEIKNEIGEITKSVQTQYVSTDNEASVMYRLGQLLNKYNDIDASVNSLNSNQLDIRLKDSSPHKYRIYSDSENTTLQPNEFIDFDIIEDIEPIWIGWVLPLLVSKQHSSMDFDTLSISAVCGLGDLASFKYRLSELSFNKISLISIISNVLKDTLLNLEIWEYVPDLINTDTQERSIFSTLYQEEGRLIGKSGYEILEELCVITNTYLTQNKGRWQFIPIEMRDSLEYNKYYSNGAFKTNETLSEFYQEVGSGTDVKIIKGTSITSVSAYRNFVVNQNYGKILQLILMPNFEQINDYISKDKINTNYPWIWENEGISSLQYASKVQKTESNQLRIDGSTDQPLKFQLSQYLILNRVEVQNTYYKLRISHQNMEGAVGYASSYKLQLRIETDKDGLYPFRYLNKNSVTGEGFFTGGEVVSSAEWLDIPCDSNEYEITFPLPISVMYSYYDAFIRIQQPDSGYIVLNYVKIIPIMEAADGIKLKARYIDDINGELYYTNLATNDLEIPINLGGVPGLPAFYGVYKNALYYATEGGGFRTTDIWELNGDKKGLIYWIIDFISEQYGISPNQLNGVVKGVFDFRAILVDTTFKDYAYMLTGGSWDLKRDEVNGTWVQINLKSIPKHPINKEIIQIFSSEAESSYEQSNSVVNKENPSVSGDYVTHTELDGKINALCIKLDGGRAGEVYLLSDILDCGGNDNN
jgi:predicted transcriptional regulator with HTH domain